MNCTRYKRVEYIISGIAGGEVCEDRVLQNPRITSLYTPIRICGSELRPVPRAPQGSETPSTCLRT